tara:strand:+ start:247 stop:810 length:564 start_codon:yes stop_codon:yes gene_type:complete
MADYLAQIITRFDAILAGGRGDDGALGTLAQARSIVADRYRKSADNFSMRDPSHPVAQYDRAYRLEWGGIGDTEEVANVRASSMLETIECKLLVGHLYGDAHAAFVRKIGSEVAATIVRQPTERASGDVVRMLRALRCGELWGNDTDPVIVDVRLIGRTSVEDFGDRLLSTASLEVVLDTTNTGYQP